MQLYLKYKVLYDRVFICIYIFLEFKDNENGKEQARHRLLNNRPRMTPAKACNYNYEGVCLAAFFKQMCTCNRPTLNDD